MDVRTLTRQELADKSVFGAGAEVIRQPLYDRLTYTDNSTTSLAFFQVPISGSKSYVMTNMELAGQLSSPKQFVLQALKVKFIQPTFVTQATLNDVLLVSRTGYLELTISDKVYTRLAPLDMFPSASGINAMVNFGGNTAGGLHASQNNALLPVYKIDPYIVIPPQVSFRVDLKWDAAVDLSANTEIQVILDGLLIRPRQ